MPSSLPSAERQSIDRRTRELDTAPSLPALTNAELKSHLKVDLSTDDDLIQDIGFAAQTEVENFTGRKLINQTWKLYIRGGFFTDQLGRIELPFAPLSSVTSVKYIDDDGDEQTWDSGEYQVVKPVGPQSMPGYIELAFEKSYPSTRDLWNSVTIEFVAGYGTVGTTSVPNGLLAAVKLIAGNLYENREELIVGTNVMALGKTVEHMMMPFRVDL